MWSFCFDLSKPRPPALSLLHILSENMTEPSLLDRQAEAGLDMVGITLETLQKVHSAAQPSRFLSLMRMPSLKR